MATDKKKDEKARIAHSANTRTRYFEFYNSSIHQSFGIALSSTCKLSKRLVGGW